MNLTPPETIFKVPKRIARCPHCGGKLHADYESVSADGRSISIGLACVNETMQDTNEHYSEFDEWRNVALRVEEWLQNTYDREEES